jgi:glyoxylase-like metal-dependent hydrolase (beta-lactamase superfamily II)
VIDTHAHADHVTAMPFFKKRFGARAATGSQVGEVQKIFRDIYNLGSDFPVDGRQFNFLLDEGEELEVGSLRVRHAHARTHVLANR